MMADRVQNQAESRFLPTAIPPARWIFGKMCGSELSGAQALLAGEFFAFHIAQNPAQPFAVGCQYRDRDGTGKASYAMIAHPIQSAVFQMIDRRLNTRMSAAGIFEPRLVLMRLGPGAQITFLRQCAFIQQLTELNLVPLSKLQAVRSGKRLRVSAMTSTAASTSPPCHRILWCRTNRC